VAVSENATVTDVDPVKSPGSNSDTRFSILNQGRLRYFIIGTVPQPSGLIVNQASDGNYCGRALKPSTIHYYQITCGSSTANKHSSPPICL
jgi:hypothetical protein